MKRAKLLRRLETTDRWDILLMDDGLIHIRRIWAQNYRRKQWTIAPLGERFKDLGKYNLTRFDTNSGKMYGSGKANTLEAVIEITKVPITQDMLDEMEATYLAFCALNPEGDKNV